MEVLLPDGGSADLLPGAAFPDAELCPDTLLPDVLRPDVLLDGVLFAADVRSDVLLADELFEEAACSAAFFGAVPLEEGICSALFPGDVLLAGALRGTELLSGLPSAGAARRGSLSPPRPALISAAVSERIFCSIASIGISSVSSTAFCLLPLSTNLPHLWQNLVPSRSTAPQSGHLISFITLVPHFGQN